MSVFKKLSRTNADRHIVKPRPKVALGLDQFDERIVPAGAVTGVVQNGSLILTGDGEDNSIDIRKGLTNVRLLGVGGTTINGGGLHDFVGVFNDVIINLGGGDDVVSLNGGGGGTAADIPRDLIFNGGAGIDTLNAEAGAMIGRDLVFNGNVGATQATLDGLIVGRNARFTGAENVQLQTMNNARANGVLSARSLTYLEADLEDTIVGRLNLIANQQLDVDLTDVLVGGNAQFQGGLGNDFVDMNIGIEILGNLNIRTRTGADAVDARGDIGGNVYINLGVGANQSLDTDNMTVYGNLTCISMGPGTNNWDLDTLTVWGSALFRLGDGADIVSFDDSEFFGTVRFLAGAGDDLLEISEGSTVFFNGPTYIDLGDGADTLQLGDGGVGEADFDFLVTLQGGNGVDTLIDLSGDFAVAPQTSGF